MVQHVYFDLQTLVVAGFFNLTPIYVQEHIFICQVQFVVLHMVHCLQNSDVNDLKPHGSFYTGFCCTQKYVLIVTANLIKS